MKRYGVLLKVDINRLARLYYRMMGNVVEEDYDFSKANHPTEKMVWQQAEISFEFWPVRQKGRMADLTKERKLLLTEVECLRSVLSEWDQDKSCYVQMIRADALAKQRSEK